MITLPFRWIIVTLFIFSSLSANPDKIEKKIEHSSQKTQSGHEPKVSSPYEQSNMDLEPFSFWGQFSKMMLALFFILILVMIGSWVLKKTVATRIQTLNKQNQIKIIERRALHPKASLYLLEVENKKILVGESTQGIHKLAELSPTTDFSDIMKEQQDK
ncbi:MAG: hypothetical protein GWP59_03970 [Chlamydiales bacterium]|nr:hypothetical protein [Chlamydiales bacterium]